MADILPPKSYWFYQKSTLSKKTWYPFSLKDSTKLENVYQSSSNQSESSRIVATDGGRYDVYVDEKIKKAIYWDEEPNEVRRATWFHQKFGETSFIPYSQDFTLKLEQHFQKAMKLNCWGTRIELTNGEVIVFYNSKIMMHFPINCLISEDWTSVTDNLIKPDRIIRGGIEELTLEQGEEDEIDHLVFMVHGVGSICDLKFRPIVEVVDDFRNMAASLMNLHFSTKFQSKKNLRIEFLPIQWHSHLHSKTTGIDNRLKLITLQSIPKLRNFSNDTILDAFCYTSPIYGQHILDAVGCELNRLFELFKLRNPNFSGSVGLVGHSLGSLIIFDILSHQQNQDSCKILNLLDLTEIRDIESALEYLNLKLLLPIFKKNQINFERFLELEINDLKNFGLATRTAVKLKNFIAKLRQNQNLSKNEDISFKYEDSRRSFITSILSNHQSNEFFSFKFPQLNFEPLCFFALGSPIAMFLIIRGIESLGEKFKLPTCDYMYNIFHPFDPIAYRLEPLLNPQFANLTPVQIPHHKGRKRMHLELKENLSKFGADLKQIFIQSWKVTWNSFLSRTNIQNENIKELPHNEVDDKTSSSSNASTKKIKNQNITNLENFSKFLFSNSEASLKELKKDFESFGRLNNGRRVDFVLQEKPIEYINEYLFAVTSHTCYWQSEDTVLLILNEMYYLNKTEVSNTYLEKYE